MAKNQTRRIAPSVLQADKDAFNALKAISNYTPANPDYAVDKIADALDNMEGKQGEEVQARTAADSARDVATAAEWEFHNLMLGATDQVAAQFTKNSNQFQSLGKKKPTEYRTRGRQSKGGGSKDGSGSKGNGSKQGA